MKFKDKKILFFAPDFFGYDLAIKEKLESCGATVCLYNERPSRNVFIKAIIRLYKKAINFYSRNYFEKILKKHKQIQFDYVLIIKGEVINKEILETYKANFTSAKFILYMWDSIQNYKDTIEALPLYDSVFSFDKFDANKYPQIKFRPLFFIDIFDKANFSISSTDIDILFIGTIHSDRWLFLNKIKQQSLGKKVFFYPYIQSPLIFFVRKFFDNRLSSLSYSEVKFKALTKENVASYISRSKIIIDIQHPKQTGLTMRCVEIIGMGKKLITTNDTIKTYDFYNPKNILIVERNNPYIPGDFLNEATDSLDENLIEKYSLEFWLNEIFD